MKKNWFFIGIGVMIAVAFSAPSAGRFIKDFHILKIGIFLAFFITGITLETSKIIEQFRRVTVLVAALASSLLIFPLIAWGLAGLFFRSAPDFIIGSIIIGVAPVTVASGTVMTAMALGNVPLSLFICVLCNFASILTIPILLNLILQFGQEPVSLPVVKMLTDLVTTVLIPTLIGQAARPRVKEIIRPYGKLFSIFNQCIVLLIILNAVANSASEITEAGFMIIYMFLFMFFFHSLILTMNYGISKAIRLDQPSTSAFTIHTSQKTLTVSYLVWAGYFAQTYPMAMIPGIAYHLVQMITDTVVAQRFKRQAERTATDHEQKEV